MNNFLSAMNAKWLWLIAVGNLEQGTKKYESVQSVFSESFNFPNVFSDLRFPYAITVPSGQLHQRKGDCCHSLSLSLFCSQGWCCHSRSINWKWRNRAFCAIVRLTTKPICSIVQCWNETNQSAFIWRSQTSKLKLQRITLMELAAKVGENSCKKPL